MKGRGKGWGGRDGEGREEKMERDGGRNREKERSGKVGSKKKDEMRNGSRDKGGIASTCMMMELKGKLKK